jgi:hypothetical protein
MARVAKAGRVRSGGAGWKWWHGVLGGMLLMLSPAAAILLLAFSAPALLAAVADTTPGRALTRTVILFSVAGAIGPMRAFFLAGHDLPTALGILTSPTTILLAWICAGFGWFLSEAFRLIATLVTNLRLAARKTALEATLKEVRTEWALAEDPAQRQ